MKRTRTDRFSLVTFSPTCTCTSWLSLTARRPIIDDYRHLKYKLLNYIAYSDLCNIAAYTISKILPLGLSINYRPNYHSLWSTAICAVAVLEDEVFVSRRKHTYIDVYDTASVHFKRRMTVDGMTDPTCIASCSVSKFLFTFDLSCDGLSLTLLIINPTNGNLILSLATHVEVEYANQSKLVRISF